MTKFIAILGRQPQLSYTELVAVHGTQNVQRTSDTSALVEASTIDIEQLGGTIKAGRVILELSSTQWQEVQKKVLAHYVNAWKNIDHKQTVGISVYDWHIAKKQPTTLLLSLKKQLKAHSVSMRIIPNNDVALNTATSHHNKLGLSPNKTELLIVKTHDNRVIIAESTGAQNISALAARDQARPKTDAFVGMLPPKLALMMINMAQPKAGAHILDPFCGTGVVLQEASLLGYNTQGTDLSEKMVSYSQDNLAWLQKKFPAIPKVTISQGDAMETSWQQPIDAVVAETYLGQPFSAPPREEKLDEVVKNCNHIISAFLRNLHPQLQDGASLCLAVPAWNNGKNYFTHLPLIQSLSSLGYQIRNLPPENNAPLLYYREGQVVARQLLLLEKI